MTRTDRRTRLLTALPATLWFLLIMTLLSLPGQSFPIVDIWKPDKIAHLLLFGGQHFLLWVSLELPAPKLSSRKRNLVVSLIATVLFGVLSEVYQDVFTSRMLDPYDMIANSFGAVMSLVCILWIGAGRILDASRRLFRLKPVLESPVS